MRRASLLELVLTWFVPTIRELFLINVSGLDRVLTGLSIFEYNIDQLCFRKLTQITDNGKTTTERWHYVIAFFQLQLRKNNGTGLGT
jgi:hypothetical protein